MRQHVRDAGRVGPGGRELHNRPKIRRKHPADAEQRGGHGNNAGTAERAEKLQPGRHDRGRSVLPRSRFSYLRRDVQSRPVFAGQH